MVHNRLKTLSKAFLKDRVRRGLDEPNLGRSVAWEVAGRFLTWARVLARQGRVFPALRACSLALSWYALSAALCVRRLAWPLSLSMHSCTS